MLDNIDLIYIFNCIKTNVSAVLSDASIKFFFITIIYIEQGIILSCMFLLFIIYVAEDGLNNIRCLFISLSYFVYFNLLIILYTIHCIYSDSSLFKYYNF